MFQRTRRFFVSRTAFIVFAAATACLAFAVTTPPGAAARFKDSTYIRYYTDATFTVMCGYKTIPCSGGIRQSGCVTEFIESESISCDMR